MCLFRPTLSASSGGLPSIRGHAMFPFGSSGNSIYSPVFHSYFLVEMGKTLQSNSVGAMAEFLPPESALDNRRDKKDESYIFEYDHQAK